MYPARVGRNRCKLLVALTKRMPCVMSRLDRTVETDDVEI